MMLEQDGKLPLAGVRVLDIATFFAAPLIASLLGDFGAEVIKVEPPDGDPYRSSHLWPQIGRNKKSVTLDLKTEAGRASLRRLVGTADVLVENLSQAVLAERGLTWPELSAAHPRLIVLSLSGFGQSGPYAGRPGNGTLGEAFAGLTHLCGPSDGAPVLPSVALGDGISALSAAYGVLNALYWRDARGGGGQRIDATMYEPILHATATALAVWKPGQPPRRLSNGLPEAPLRNVYLTADGKYVVVAASLPRHLAALLNTIGAPGAQDPNAAMAEWARRHTREDVIAALTEQGLLVGPVNDLDDVLADPQVQWRESLMQVDDPVYGRILLPTPSPRLSVTPGTLRWATAELGEHNEEILGPLREPGAG